MNTNLPIGGLQSSLNSERVLPKDIKVSSGDGIDKVKTSKELKLAQLEGENIPISEEQLVKALERAIKAVEGTSTSLDFSIHEKTKHIMIKVLNKETGELIREIPSEKSLDFLAKVWEMAGALVDERR
jgi:flagellar protein FlaG